jgi:hypothetical protein
VKTFRHNGDWEGDSRVVPLGAPNTNHVLVGGTNELEHDELDGGLGIDDPIVSHARLRVRVALGPEVEGPTAWRDHLDDQERRASQALLFGLLLIDDGHIGLQDALGSRDEIDGGDQHRRASSPSGPEQPVQRSDDNLMAASGRGCHDQRSVEELVAPAIVGELSEILIGQ